MPWNASDISSMLQGNIVLNVNEGIAVTLNEKYVIDLENVVSLIVWIDSERREIVEGKGLTVEIAIVPTRYHGNVKVGRIVSEKEVGVMTGNGSERKGGGMSLVSVEKKGRHSNSI